MLCMYVVWYVCMYVMLCVYAMYVRYICYLRLHVNAVYVGMLCMNAMCVCLCILDELYACNVGYGRAHVCVYV